VKRLIAITVDSALICVSVVLALYLRLGEALPAQMQMYAVATGLVTALPVFVVAGLYRTIFRYSSWPALAAVFRGVVISSVPFVGVVTMVGLPGIPRTVGIIHPILLLLLVSGSRAVAHAFLAAPYAKALGDAEKPRVLIYGAGSAGMQLLAGLRQSNRFVIVGFLDDDRMLIGERLHGLQIYSPRELGSLHQELGITDVLLAIPTASRHRRSEIVTEIRKFGLHVRTMPGLTDIALGNVAITDIRELEVTDLLGRGPVAPNEDLLAANVAGKTLLVTGAGGSIGSELCRQITALKPKRLVLLDNSEFALYSIHRELSRLCTKLGASDLELTPILGSVTDSSRMRSIFRSCRPHTVYHAAAYKHVPMVEANVIEGMKNNVFGTITAAEAAIECGVANFVLISTDKAVRPTNVMGATKRLAEISLQALAERGGGTCFAMVRFGNVLGSSGSVVPLFRQQIREGGPVTVTHEDVIRYFMTIPEAAQLVIQASAMASGGEVFVLDMGEPVRVMDLARNMIELSGLTVRDAANPDGDIEVVTVGLRPGEKLYEELLIGENPQSTTHPRILKANETFIGWQTLEPCLSDLEARLSAQDDKKCMALLRKLVPEFAPQSPAPSGENPEDPLRPQAAL
jgi:FlaA1/EpsC-like NDP-sugar epimerase